MKNDIVIENEKFSLYGGAVRIQDSTASGGYCAKMDNNVDGWSIQYSEWDFSYLKAGVSYEASFKIKVRHGAVFPDCGAFRIGIYDYTDNSFVIEQNVVPVSETSDMVWIEYKLGTFKPNQGVNLLCFYVAGTANYQHVPEIYVDSILFKEYFDHVIDANEFYLYNNAELISDGMASNGSAARIVNGSEGQWSIQVPIHGAQIVMGKSYMVHMSVMPERSDWDTSSGAVFGYLVYDFTTGSYLAEPTIVDTLSGLNPCPRLPYYYNFKFGPIQPQPSHDVRLILYQVDNAANFPSLKVNQVTLKKVPQDESREKFIKAFPYKISPVNVDGCNDFTTIKYTLPSHAAVTVRIYKVSDNSLVRMLLNGVEQTGGNEVVWNGKDDQGQVVPNGLYVVRIDDSVSNIFSVNVQVISGVVLKAAAVQMTEYVPKGVWFSGGHIPYNSVDAEIYLDSCFSDIRRLGADTVIISSFHAKPSAVYTAAFDIALKYGLKIIALPDWNTIINEGLYNDEIAMFHYLACLIQPFKAHAALLGYYLYDEPPFDAVFAGILKNIKRMLETIDPEHPVFITNVGPERIALHYNAQKPRVNLIDPYGAGWEGKTGDFTHIYKLDGFSFETYLDFAYLQSGKDIYDDVPLWTVLQTFCENSDFRDPTPAEVRVMTYEAIGHGSKGFIFFIYQTMLDWKGLVDENYIQTVDYATVQALFNEIETMKPTIQNMRRIGNAAAAVGGGNSAYAGADVTTHEDRFTGDKYLVIVNHDCEKEQDVTIIIDRNKLGMRIASVMDLHHQVIIPFDVEAEYNITINLKFAAGDGKLLKLVKDSSITEYAAVDRAFEVYDGISKNDRIVPASDFKTAGKSEEISYGRDVRWCWDRTKFTSGAAYDLFVVVRIEYTRDLYHIGKEPYIFVPAGNAFSCGVYDVSEEKFIIPDKLVPAANMENMLWYTVKVGTFIPSQTNTQYVYIRNQADMENICGIHVDRFYFEMQSP